VKLRDTATYFAVKYRMIDTGDLNGRNDKRDEPAINNDETTSYQPTL
jgi:hypothetical protein